MKMKAMYEKPSMVEIKLNLESVILAGSSSDDFGLGNNESGEDDV